MDEELQALMDAADAERDEIEQSSGTDEGGTEGHRDGIARDEDDIARQDVTSQNEDEATSTDVNDTDDTSHDSDDTKTDDTPDNLNDENMDDNSGDDNNLQNEDTSSDFKPIEVDINGTKVSISSQEELVQLATRGIKSGTVKPNVDSENDMFVQQGELSKDDLRTMIEAKAGNPAAIAKIAAMGQVDLDDLDEEAAQSYQPQFDIQRQSEVEVVASEILRDEAHANEFKALTNELPQDFVGNIASDPTRLRAFSNHIKSGLAQETIPLAYKDVALNGGSFFEAYARIGQRISDQRKNTRPQTPTERKPKMSEREEQMRRRATGADKSSSSNGSKTEADDILAMTDAEFEKLVLNSRRD